MHLEILGIAEKGWAKMDCVKIGEEQLMELVEQFVLACPEGIVRLTERARKAMAWRIQRDTQRAADMETIALLLLSRMSPQRLRKKDRELLMTRLRPWIKNTAFKWEDDLARFGLSIDAEKDEK